MEKDIEENLMNKTLAEIYWIVLYSSTGDVRCHNTFIFRQKINEEVIFFLSIVKLKFSCLCFVTLTISILLHRAVSLTKCSG